MLVGQASEVREDIPGRGTAFAMIRGIQEWCALGGMHVVWCGWNVMNIWQSDQG